VAATCTGAGGIGGPALPWSPGWHSRQLQMEGRRGGAPGLASAKPALVVAQAQSTPRLQEYLVAHQAYAPGGAMVGGARNIRTVAASGEVADGGGPHSPLVGARSPAGIIFGTPRLQRPRMGWPCCQRIAQGSRQLTYSGTFVYRSGGKGGYLAHRPLLADGLEVERIEALDGSPREGAARRERSQMFLPGRKSSSSSRNRSSQRGFPALLPRVWAVCPDNYKIRSGGRGRVAGLNSQAVLAGAA